VLDYFWLKDPREIKVFRVIQELMAWTANPVRRVRKDFRASKGDRSRAIVARKD
jgi:hypothetical protein